MSGASESSILKQTLIAVTALQGTMAWRNNTGLAWAGDMVQVRAGQTITLKPGMVVLTNARPLRAGLPGSGDILGVSHGRAFSIECKDARGRQSEQQKKFQSAFERSGGLYVLARSADDAVEGLNL